MDYFSFYRRTSILVGMTIACTQTSMMSDLQAVWNSGILLYLPFINKSNPGKSQWAIAPLSYFRLEGLCQQFLLTLQKAKSHILE